MGTTRGQEPLDVQFARFAIAAQVPIRVPVDSEAMKKQSAPSR